MNSKSLLLLVLSAILGQAVWAQSDQSPQPGATKRQIRKQRINQLIRQEEEGELVYNKQSIFGYKQNTDGYALTYEFGRFKSSKKTLLFQYEFSEKHHPKESKIGGATNGYWLSSFKLGKLNNFYQLKVGVSQQQRIGGKANKNGVAVSAIYGGALSIGLMKPYYYYFEVIDTASESSYTEVTTFDKQAPNSYIFQAAGFTKGLGESKFNPGLVAKGAIRFDYGRFRETVSAIEVGMAAEIYSRKVPQLAFVTPQTFFFNAYVSLLIGRRR
ncbi:MAG: hypothetical protein RL732_1620 [Bacteroidota bacterium]